MEDEAMINMTTAVKWNICEENTIQQTFGKLVVVD